MRLRGLSLRKRLGLRTEQDLVPYGMFERPWQQEHLRSARILERVYHKGQDKAWEGKKVLADLVEQHGGVSLAPDKAKAVQRLFAVILWGELAAWKVAAQLALELEPLEAKLAATSQAHDEARHFYVMHDYLQLLGYEPEPLPAVASGILERVLGAKDLTRKLLGMQLMVEPMALTIFQTFRESRIEPVLADLLLLYERDEARHVAIGVHYLPARIQAMTPWQAASMWRWQLSLLDLEFRALTEMAKDFEVLGVDPRQLFQLGTAKTALAIRMMAEQLGTDLPIIKVFRRYFDCRMELAYPRSSSTRQRVADLFETALNGIDSVETTLAPVPA